jgi:hypothetical protein
MPYGSQPYSPEVSGQLLGSGLGTHPLPGMSLIMPPEEPMSLNSAVQAVGGVIATQKRAVDQSVLQQQVQPRLSFQQMLMNKSIDELKNINRGMATSEHPQRNEAILAIGDELRRRQAESQQRQ